MLKQVNKLEREAHNIRSSKIKLGITLLHEINAINKTLIKTTFMCIPHKLSTRYLMHGIIVPGNS